MKGEIVQFPGSEKYEKKKHENGEIFLNINIFIEMLEFMAAQAKFVPSTRHAGNIAERQTVLLKPATDCELIQRVNSSSINDWKHHPAYYHALTSEIQNRDLIPKSNKD